MSRRILRRVGVLLACLLVLALAASLAFALYGKWRMGRALERFEGVLGQPDLASFNLPKVGESENAATWLVAGAGAIVSTDKRQELLRSRGGDDEAWSARETALANRMVEDNAPALELLRRAAGCTVSSYELDYRQGPDVELPPLVQLLSAGQVLWIDARLALAAGDLRRLRIDLEALDRLADSLSRESLLIAALLAQAIDRYYLDLVHRLVTDGSEDRDLLADVEAVLAGRDRQADYLRALAAEGSMLVAVSPDRVLEPEGVRSPSWLGVRLNRFASLQLVPALLDEFSAVGGLVAQSWPEVVAASEERIARGFPRSSTSTLWSASTSFAVTLYPNLIDSIGKLKAGQSASQMALEAVRQRRVLLSGGAYRPGGHVALVDPYTGHEVVIEPRPDGSLVIEAPGAVELWRESHTVRSRLGDPHFVWLLPPAR